MVTYRRWKFLRLIVMPREVSNIRRMNFYFSSENDSKKPTLCPVPKSQHDPVETICITFWSNGKKNYVQRVLTVDPLKCLEHRSRAKSPTLRVPDDSCSKGIGLDFKQVLTIMFPTSYRNTWADWFAQRALSWNAVRRWHWWEERKSAG